MTRKPDEVSRIKGRSAVERSTVVEEDNVLVTITAAVGAPAIGTREINTTREVGSTMARELAHPSEAAGVAIIKAGEVDPLADVAATLSVVATTSKANPQAMKTETTTGGTSRTTDKTTVTSQPRANTRSTPGVVEEVQAAPWEAEVVTKAKRPVGVREATKTTTPSPSTNTGTSTIQVEAAVGGRALTSKALVSTK